MTPDEILAALASYNVELGEILRRFTRDRDGFHIASHDNYRLRTIATELIDLLRDHVPGSGQHIGLIADSYNDGVSNFFHSSSYASVEEIRGVVTAVSTRIERNKSLFAESNGPIAAGPDQRELPLCNRPTDTPIPCGGGSALSAYEGASPRRSASGSRSGSLP